MRWFVEEHVHRQRHFPEADVLAAIDSAGLRRVEATEEPAGELSSPLDKTRYSKTVYVCVADAS